MSKVLADPHIADVNGNDSLQFENVISLQLAQPNLLYDSISTAFVVPSMMNCLDATYSMW